MKCYTFLGLPASGKGTQTEMFAKLTKSTIIGTGDLVREEITSCDLTDPFCKSIKERYDKGIPQPNDIITDLVKKKIEKINSDIILDNYPFNKGQVKDYKDMIDTLSIEKAVLVVINITAEEAIKRIVLRRVCADCKKVFNDQSLEFCDKCSGPLISRSDDNIDVIKERIKKYQPSIKEVVEEFKNVGTIYQINGIQTIEEVFSEIKEKVLNETS